MNGLSLFGVLASCLVLSLTAQSIVGDELGDTLKNLCDNKPVKLESLSGTLKVVELIKTSNSLSCQKYKESLLDLESILAQVISGKSRNSDFQKSLRDYHQKYIASETNEVKDDIPKSLRQFFISMCFQISAELKINLINDLQVDSKELINEDDYETIKLLNNFGNTFTDSENPILDFDDIVLVGDLTRLAGEEAEAETKLMIKLKTGEVLKKLVKTCNQKFKPIYDKLILPIIALSNMGYDYRGELVKYELKELKENPLVRQWYIIVQTCEAFKSIEIFEDKDALTDGDRQAFTFLDTEEANKLRETQPSLTCEADDVQPIQYNPPSFHNDQLWIKDQTELESLVSKYKASASEIDRIKSKMIRKLLMTLKENLKSGKIVMYFADMVKSQITPNNDKLNINEEIISSIDDAIEETEEEKTISVLDSQVQGPRRAPKIPTRPARIKKVTNGTKWSKRVGTFFTTKILPSRMKIFLWFCAIVGILFVLVAILSAVG